MSGPMAVETQDLVKTYKVYGSPMDRVKEFVTRGRTPRHLPVHALRGVTVSVPPGSALGVVGSNGAGKSTFLKILSGTSRPTSGTYRIHGRVASLLELGTGFHDDFTGRQNIHLNGVIMGMSRREIRQKVDEIIEFSELKEFIDAPIRTYSAGMTMRLGFSVATAIDPDVLILDEILAVGDMHFQKKCIDRIYSFRHAGKSILFCSHSLYDVRQICDEVIWIRDGIMEMHGDPMDVTHAYANYERARTISREVVEGVETTLPPSPRQTAIPRILSVSVVDPETGDSLEQVPMSRGVDLICDYEVASGGPKFDIGFTWFRSDRIPVATTSTRLHGTAPSPEASGRFRARVHIPSVDLIQGEFYIQAFLIDDAGTHLFDHQMRSGPLVVVQRSRDVGLFLIDHEWTIDAASATTAETD